MSCPLLSIFFSTKTALIKSFDDYNVQNGKSNEYSMFLSSPISIIQHRGPLPRTFYCLPSGMPHLPVFLFASLIVLPFPLCRSLSLRQTSKYERAPVSYLGSSVFPTHAAQGACPDLGFSQGINHSAMIPKSPSLQNSSSELLKF
jgi:hypothetical protein